MKIVDRNGKTVRLNDRNRTLLARLESDTAERICKSLNDYSPRSLNAPFTVQEEA